MSDSPIQRFGAYEIVGELGRGGMGVVYRAIDPGLGREIAVKVLPPDVGSDGRSLVRFRREAQLLAAMNHPNIATIHSLEEADGTHFITMECVEGETLGEWIDRGALSIEETISMGRQIATGLEAAHKRGIVHRDLKPMNVMITPDKLVKILDFGLAKSEETTDGATMTGMVRGTPGYMSPEQLRGIAVDHRADIWAFGAILFECLSGKKAFGGETPSDRIASTLQGEPDWSALPDSTPARLEKLIRHCLERSTDARMDRIASARHDIEEEVAQRSLPSGITEKRERIASTPNNLPLQLARFIGRKKALDDVKILLERNRLVSLTGAGGTGKTRLAVETAMQLRADYPDGVWIVELAVLSDPDLLLQTVFDVLRIKEEPGRTMTALLAEAVCGKNLLLILDNCEHLRDACAGFAESLLRSCPDVKILATTREALGITGETIYHVPALASPGAGSGTTLEKIESMESVRLFVDRARAVDGAFKLTEENAGAVAKICRHLGGIPLALELAAARVKVLPVQDIAERLHQSFQLFTTGSATSLPRHRTLQALIDWSYDLLEEKEKVLFRRLSVHVGGWTLEGAEAVCAGDGIEDWEVLDLLSHLVDKSLVEIDAEGGRATGRARYRMLETVNQYAAGRLSEVSGEEDARRRHRQFFLGLAERAEPALMGLDQGIWMRRMHAERDNLRLALEECSPDRCDPLLGMRFAGALGRVWSVRGNWAEGIGIAQCLLDHSGAQARTPERAKLLNLAGNLHVWGRRDYDIARGRFEEGLAIYRELGDQGGEAGSVANLGHLANTTGKAEEACDLYCQALELRRHAGDPRGIASALMFLGHSQVRLGDHESARATLSESSGIYEKLGDQSMLMFLHERFGTMAFREGDLDGAARYFAKSSVLLEGLDNNWLMGMLAENEGKIALLRDDLEKARKLFRESAMVRREVGEQASIACSLEAGGLLAGAEGSLEAALVLLASAEALREETDVPLLPLERTDLDELIERARKEMGEKDFRAAWRKGRALPMDEALDLAIKL